MHGRDDRVRQLGEQLRQRGERLALAESCTGGLLAALL
jgi:nicotinamide mononucleotide (NMN) deamidase PncC